MTGNEDETHQVCTIFCTLNVHPENKYLYKGKERGALHTQATGHVVSALNALKTPLSTFSPLSRHVGHQRVPQTSEDRDL